MRKERKELMKKMNALMIKGESREYQYFVNKLFAKGFFNNIPEYEIECSLEDEEIVFSEFNNGKIQIVIEYIDDKHIVGIDPANCFDKISKSSVIAYFPMSKREYARFSSFFDKLTDTKSKIYRDWKKEAPSSFCGAYAMFGV